MRTAIGGVARLALVLLVLTPTLSLAHEFWIDPVFAQAEPAPIDTDLRVGQLFVGEIYPYISSKFNFLKVSTRGKSADIPGNEGDMPAIHIKAPSPGLNVIAFYGKPNRVTFTDAETFLVYLTTEGLGWVLKKHQARGLPMSGFDEVFSRTVKSLAQVGPVEDEDKDIVVGMPLELVAGENPYAYPALAKLPVTLLWEGKPLPDTQISVFRERDKVVRSTVTTDAEGRAEIELEDGGRFLVNAVHMREAAPELNAAWESHWASLTFALQPK